MIKATINNEVYTIVNIYGPNKDAEAVKFYQNLSKLMRNNEFGNEEILLLVGTLTVHWIHRLIKKVDCQFLENT